VVPNARIETYKEEIKIRVSPTKKTNISIIKNLIPGDIIILIIKKVAINSINTTIKKTFSHFQIELNNRTKTPDTIRFSYKLMCFSVIAYKVLTFKVCTLSYGLGCYPNLIVFRI
jgi:hypothetical protein